MELNFDIEKDLNKKVYDFLKIITSCAVENNINIYIVGGVVRDKILKKEIKDIDLIVEYDAIAFSKFLPDIIKVQSIHKDFKTVKVDYLNKHFDIASTRLENYPYSGCLPKVNKVGINIVDDVKRRDFSVNSLYLKLGLNNDKLTFKLIDLVDGVNDINKKTLKVLHSKSYIDDPTRIIRGLGFKYRFDFDFSKEDKKLINDYLKNINLENASIDRIKAVFYDVLKTDYSNKIFKEIIENKYFKLLGIESLNVDFDLINNIIKSFNLTNNADFYMNILENNKVLMIDFKDKLEIIKTFSKLKDYELAYYFYKTKDSNVKKYNQIKDIKLSIKGQDLLKLGIQQGKIVGEILDKLLLFKIENNLKNYSFDDEINWVKENFLK